MTFLFTRVDACCAALLLPPVGSKIAGDRQSAVFSWKSRPDVHDVTSFDCRLRWRRHQAPYHGWHDSGQEAGNVESWGSLDEWKSTSRRAHD